MTIPWTTDLLRVCAKDALTKLAGRPPGPWKQPFTTAFAILTSACLARRLAPRRAPVMVYAAPHARRTTKLIKNHIETSNEWEKIRRNFTHGVRCFHMEWMVDITCVEIDKAAKKKEMPVLGVESEAAPGHSVDYSFRTSGFIWDFCKLLHFNCPHLLFIAVVNRARGNRIAERHGRVFTLRDSIDDCLRDYVRLLDQRSLGVILIPSAHRDASEGQVGASSNGAPIRWEGLNLLGG